MTEIDDLVKTTTRGSLILMLGQISSTLVLAAGMLLVARFLGPSNYGSYSKASSVISIVFLLTNLGITAAMVKYISNFRSEHKNGHIKVYIETGLIINIIISLLATTIIYISAEQIATRLYNDPTQTILIQYLSIGIIGQALLNYSRGVITGFERMELRSITQIVNGLAKSILSPLLVYLGYGALGPVLGQTGPVLLGGTLGTIFIIILYKNTKSTNRPITHIQATREILKYSFPLYLSGIFNGVLPHLYTTLLGIWVTDTEIGNYSVAKSFSVLLSFVTMPIAATLFPLFSKLDTEKPELRFLYRNAVKYSTLFGYPIIWTIIALAEPIINALYQNQYAPASNYLRIYMLSYIVIGIGSTSNGALLNSQNRTDLIFRSTITRFIIAVPLSIAAIRYLGVAGLIFTFFTSLATNTLIDYYNINRIFNYKINTKFLIKILTISLISTTIVYTTTNQLHLNPWLELAIGGITSLTIYITGLITLKPLTQQDLKYLTRISNNFGPLTPIINKILEILQKTI